MFELDTNNSVLGQKLRLSCSTPGAPAAGAEMLGMWQEGLSGTA